MVTTALILAILFSVIALILLGTIFVMYLGGKTSLEGYIFMYAALFFVLAWAAVGFSNHFQQIQKQATQTTIQEESK